MDMRIATRAVKEVELCDRDGYRLWFGQSTAEPATAWS